MSSPRTIREALETQIVGPYGILAWDSRGRQPPEAPCPKVQCTVHPRVLAGAMSSPPRQTK